MNASAYCPPALGPTTFTSGLLNSWLEGWSVAARMGFQTVSRPPSQDPRTDGRPALVRADDEPRGRRRGPPRTRSCSRRRIARLRDFSIGRRRRTSCPTLVLPPQAGHDSCIVDYSSEQSQMRTILSSGLERAFSLDWIGATRETAGRDDRGLPRRGRPRRRPLRRARQPDRRLPGRLARDDLRRAVARARQHADARRRADRLPRRRAGDPRGRPAARAGTAISASTRRWSPPDGGVLKGRAHARGLHHDPARQTRSRGSSRCCCNLDDAAHVAALPRVRGLVQAHPGHPGRVLPVDRRAPVPRQRARRAARSRSVARRSTSSGSTCR